MRPVFRSFQPTPDWDWINSHVGIQRCEDTGGITAVDADTGELLAACVIDNMTQNSVQTHLVIARPLVIKHGFLDCCADVIYNSLGMSRVYALVPANNAKAVRLNKHIGFTVKTVLEEAYEVGVDYLVMEMKRENCRFLPQQAQQVA